MQPKNRNSKDLTVFFFDFDGTLFDTYPEMTTSLLQTAKKSGIVLTSSAVFNHLRQTSVHQTFDFFFPQAAVRQKIFYEYRLLEKQNAQQARPFAQIKTVCQTLFKNHKLLFLLTHRDQSAWQLLAAAGLKKYFTGGVTAAAGFKRKPDPAALNYLCQEFAIDPQKAVMIGDRPLDIIAGHRAGMQGWLFTPDDLIDYQPADQIFADYTVFLTLLKH